MKYPVISWNIKVSSTALYLLHGVGIVGITFLVYELLLETSFNVATFGVCAHRWLFLGESE